MNRKITKIEELDIDPEGDIDEVIDFLEMGSPPGDEWGEFCETMGNLGRHRYTMSDSFREAYEEEVRITARTIKQKYFNVSYEEDITRQHTSTVYGGHINSHEVTEETILPACLREQRPNLPGQEQ